MSRDRRLWGWGIALAILLVASLAFARHGGGQSFGSGGGGRSILPTQTVALRCGIGFANSDRGFKLIVDDVDVTVCARQCAGRIGLVSE